MIAIRPEERDAIYRQDFIAFFRKAFEVLNPAEKFDPAWHLEAIGRLLEDCNGTRARKIINAPPRSLKSFLVSVAWVAFSLSRDPTHRFICVSYSGDLAAKLHADCRRLMESEWYCNLTATRLEKSTENELVTTKGGYRYATSVGGTLTGLGADTIIVDDPLSAGEARSEVSRRNVIEWFSKVLMSRLNSKRLGTVIIVMQRLHMEDLTGHLMEVGGWDLLCLPAKALQDVSIPVWRGVYAWKIDEPLQPTREGYDVLDELKRELGAEAFHAQYLQTPVPAGGNMLKREWLKWCQLAPTRHSSDEIVLSVETAAKATATSNYSVILVFLVRNKNEFYLIDLYRKKLEFPDLLKAIEALITKHKPKAVLIEDHSSGTGLCQQLKKNGCAGIIPIRPVNDKSTRMSTETPKLEAGNLILPRVAPWIDDFIVEYLAFPNGKHDDQIDGLSQFLNWQGNRPAPTPFSFDFGHDIDQCGGPTALGAPTAEDILFWRGLR
jgi:predicted phage terminase large subunit-like protein